MQSIKGNITRLKKRVQESLPSTNDLFGYPGVTQAGIVDLLDRAYGHVTRLEEISFDVALVMLKRKLSGPLYNAKQYLDESVNGLAAKEKFNGFLNDIAQIHDSVILTYYVFADQTIRDQAQVDSILDQVSSYEQQISQLAANITECVNQVSASASKFEVIESAEEQVAASLESVLSDSSEIESTKSNVTAAREVINQYRTDAKEVIESLSSSGDKAVVNERKTTRILSEAGKAKELMDELLSSADEIRASNSRQQEEIDRTISSASKYGMAASFKTRKDELSRPMVVWGVAFVISIVALLVFSVYYVIPAIPPGKDWSEVSIVSILIKVVVVSPLVWMGWMAAKQYSFLSKIREDYSYKYASALAFEGYKKEAISVDQEMAKDLLKVAIVNLSLNPLRIYDSKGNHSSPLSELFSTIFRHNTQSKE